MKSSELIYTDKSPPQIEDSVIIAAGDISGQQFNQGNITGTHNFNSNFDHSMDNSAHQTMASLNYTPNQYQARRAEMGSHISMASAKNAYLSKGVANPPSRSQNRMKT